VDRLRIGGCTTNVAVSSEHRFSTVVLLQMLYVQPYKPGTGYIGWHKFVQTKEFSELTDVHSHSANNAAHRDVS
jgi:hypothetical protein